MSSLMTTGPQPGCEETASKPSGVLIVSSNQDLRRNLITRLESGPWNLMEAGSGAEATQDVSGGPEADCGRSEEALGGVP